MSAKNYMHDEEVTQDELAERDRAALAQPRPLGIRGLADRWTARCLYCGEAAACRRRNQGYHCALCCDGTCIPIDPLAAFEIEALLGWVHREMVREVARRAGLRSAATRLADAHGLDVSELCDGWDGLDDSDREALACHVAQLLGGAFVETIEGHFGPAWTLCEMAAKRFGGWP